MAKSAEVKDAYSYTPEDVRNNLPSKTFQQFKIKTHEVDYWEDTDDRPRLVLTTEVVGGDYDGNRGPRITLSIEVDEERVVKGGRNGTFTVTRDGSITTVVAMVFALNNGEMVAGVTEPTPWDSQTLDEIGVGLVGAEFIRKVEQDANGYDKFTGRTFPLSDPPEGLHPRRRPRRFRLTKSNPVGCCLVGGAPPS